MLSDPRPRKVVETAAQISGWFDKRKLPEERACGSSMTIPTACASLYPRAQPCRTFVPGRRQGRLRDHPAAYPTACTSAMPAPRSAILSSARTTATRRCRMVLQRPVTLQLDLVELDHLPNSPRTVKLQPPRAERAAGEAWNRPGDWQASSVSSRATRSSNLMIGIVHILSRACPGGPSGNFPDGPARLQAWP
jgi:hypothetical protein